MVKLIIVVAATAAFWFYASNSFEETFGDDKSYQAAQQSQE